MFCGLPSADAVSDKIWFHKPTNSTADVTTMVGMSMKQLSDS